MDERISSTFREMSCSSFVGVADVGSVSMSLSAAVRVSFRIKVKTESGVFLLTEDEDCNLLLFLLLRLPTGFLILPVLEGCCVCLKTKQLEIAITFSCTCTRYCSAQVQYTNYIKEGDSHSLCTCR